MEAAKTYRAHHAATAAGMPPARLRALAAAGLPISSGTAAGEHRRWCPRTIFISAVANELLSAGMSPTAAAELLRPHTRWLLSGEPAKYFDITNARGSIVCRVQLGHVAAEVRDRLAVLDAAVGLSTTARRVDAAPHERNPA